MNRLNTFETKMETMQRQFADYQNGQTLALTKSLTGVAEQLQKVTSQALHFAGNSSAPQVSAPAATQPPQFIAGPSVQRPAAPEPVQPAPVFTKPEIQPAPIFAKPEVPPVMPKTEIQPKPQSDVKIQSSQNFFGKFDKKEGEWDCKACYVRNKPDVSSCVSCGTGKDGEEKPNMSTAFKPTTFTPNSGSGFGTGQPHFGVKPATFGQPAQAPVGKSTFFLSQYRIAFYRSSNHSETSRRQEPLWGWCQTLLLICSCNHFKFLFWTTCFVKSIWHPCCCSSKSICSKTCYIRCHST